MLAKTIATLDHFSGGRFMFGISVGWLKEETEVMGGDFPHRWTQTREAILAMKELWTREEAEYRGQYYDFPPVLSFPKPVQKPHPPILLGGTARQVFQRVVAWGDGWMPNRVTAEEIRRGRTPSTNSPGKPGVIRSPLKSWPSALQASSGAGRPSRSWPRRGPTG